MKALKEVTEKEREDVVQYLQRGRFILLNREPFIAYGAMKLVLQADDSVKTLATDGQRIYYNPAYVRWTETTGVMCWDYAVSEIVHETLHPFFGHCRDWKPLGFDDPDLVNEAQDYVVNLHVKDMGFPIHPDWFFDETWRGFVWQEIYWKLKESGGGKSKPCPCQVRPQPAAPGKDEDAPGEGGQPGSDGKLIVVGPGGVEEETYNAWDRIVVEAMQFSTGMGKVPAFAQQLVNEVTAPRIHWQAIVQRYMRRASKGDYSFMRPNKRYLHRGLILPSNTTRRAQVVNAIDTSGSCWGMLKDFFSETYGLARALKIDMDVIECDTKPTMWRCRRPDDVKRIKHRGSGGTDFRPVFEAIDKGICEDMEGKKGRVRRPDLLIFLTDGDGTYPKTKPHYPVLWCIPGGGVKPPFGSVVTLPMKQGK